jgi:hypothetical protein
VPSSPAGAYSNQSGPASVYNPTGQAQADQGYQGILGALTPSAINYGTQTPGGVAYNQSLPWSGQGSIADPNNPYYQQALGASQQAYSGYSPYSTNITAQGAGPTSPYGQAVGAANYASGYAPGLEQYAGNLGYQLGTAGLAGIPYGGQILNQSFNNPYLSQALGGAQTGAQYGQAGAQAAAGAAPQVSGYAQQVAGAAPQLFGAGSSILNTAFDPQSALFNQQTNLVGQQAAAGNALSGVGQTPYGQSLANQAQSQFDINWQNNLLNREATGISGANTAFQGGAGLDQTAAGLDASALGLSSGASNLAATSAGLPSGVYAGNIGLENQGLGAYNSNLQQGGAIGNTVSGLENAGLSQYQALNSNPLSVSTTGAQDASSVLSGLNTFGGMPYSTQSTGTSNALSDLTNTAQLGDLQYYLPQMLMGDLNSYLGLGQNASSISGQLGALGLSEQQNAFSGLGSGLGSIAGMLGFGNGGLGNLLGIGGGGGGYGLLGTGGL